MSPQFAYGADIAVSFDRNALMALIAYFGGRDDELHKWSKRLF
jgi:hypothetical protein